MSLHNKAETQATIVIVRSIKPGFRERHDEWLQRVIQAMSTFEGYRSISVMKPPQNEAAGTYTLSITFDTDEHFKAWQRSPAHDEIISEADDWFEGGPQIQEATGYEVWFDAPSAPPLSRLRQASVLWLVLTPLTSFLLPPTAAFISGYVGRIVAAFITSALMIVFMTWVLMPLIMRVFGRWLHPRRTRPVPRS